MLYQIIQAGIICLFPLLLVLFQHRFRGARWLSPVVLCYLMGIGVRNLGNLPLSDELSMKFSEGTVILAIPLLLFVTDFQAWLRLARTTLLSFAFMIAGVIISAAVGAWLFREHLPQTWLLSGMLSAVFIGGTANMNMVGMALGADEGTFIRLNAAEIAVGGMYLILLTSVSRQFFGLFLPEFEGDRHAAAEEFFPRPGIYGKDIAKALGLTIAIVALSAGLVWLTQGSLEKPAFFILMLSAFGLAASFFPAVRKWRGSYETGEFLLLIFSVAIGMMADFTEIFKDGWLLIGFCTFVLVLAVSLHVLACRFFRIDRDTMIITSTAGIYGPPFIGQVAAAIQNRSMVFSGMLTALAGIAIANFIGVLLGTLLK
jgi:uncharacterized membrane protein